MTTQNGETNQIKIKMFKEVENWIPADFVRYFYHRGETIYGKEKIEKNYDKDCMLTKRLLDFFKENKHMVIDFLKYIDWSIEKYLQQQNALPMQFGILNLWTEEYMNIPLTTKKPKKKRTTPLLSKEMKDWIETEKKRTKSNVVS